MTVRQYKRAGKARWFVDIRVGTTRVRKASPVNTRRGAERYEREIREQLAGGTYGATTREVPTLAAFAPEFMEGYVRANNKHSEADTKRSILEHHIVPAFGRMRLDAIGPQEIERYKAAKLRKLAPKTINNHLTVLRKLLVVANEWRRLEHVPIVKWLKVPKPTFRFLDFDEAERLLATAEPAWCTMILVALRTGLRQGELLALRWTDVDLRAGRLVVRQATARGVVGTPKSGRQREVPLARGVVAALREHRHLRGELVFCNEDGSPLRKNQCRRPLGRARARAGLLELGWHDLRHTFASHLVMRGVSVKAVQELMGHATIEMTMRYAHLSPDVKRDAVELLEAPPRLLDARGAT